MHNNKNNNNNAAAPTTTTITTTTTLCGAFVAPQQKLQHTTNLSMYNLKFT